MQVSEPAPNNARLTGRTVVITGASDGIGRAASRMFAEMGANVVMVGRNEAKTAAAAQSIMSTTGSRTVTWLIADLSKQREVRTLAERLLERLPQIHVLVNNAGALFTERRETEDGLERTFALNHLAYFTLTLLLLERLASSATPDNPSRVILVASRAHKRADFEIDDLQTRENYGGWRAYNRSKLENLLFMRELANGVNPRRVVVHALHPGVVSSRFATNNGSWGRTMRRVMDVGSVTPEQGADTLVWLASAPAAAELHGQYWVKREVRTPSKIARSASLARELWTRSAELAHLDADALVRSANA